MLPANFSRSLSGSVRKETSVLFSIGPKQGDVLHHPIRCSLSVQDGLFLKRIRSS